MRQNPVREPAATARTLIRESAECVAPRPANKPLRGTAPSGVVMAVEQNGRLPRRFLPARNHHRVPFGRHQAGLEPDPGEHLDKERADFDDADILGADARVPNVID